MSWRVSSNMHVGVVFWLPSHSNLWGLWSGAILTSYHASMNCICAPSLCVLKRHASLHACLHYDSLVRTGLPLSADAIFEMKYYIKPSMLFLTCMYRDPSMSFSKSGVILLKASRRFLCHSKYVCMKVVIDYSCTELMHGMWPAVENIIYQV